MPILQGDEDGDDRAPAAGPRGLLSAGRVPSEGRAVGRRSLDAARRAAPQAARRVAPSRRVMAAATRLDSS